MIQTAKVATKHAGGRPTKKTPEMVENLRSSISDGLSFKAAAHLHRITQDTFYRWVADDPEFSETIKQARAEAVARWVRSLEFGMPGWQSKAWLLERLEFDDWGMKQRIEHTGKDGEKLNLLWAWETNGTNGNSAGTSPDAGNGSSLHSEIPCTRLRAPVGKNGS